MFFRSLCQSLRRRWTDPPFPYNGLHPFAVLFGFILLIALIILIGQL